MVSSSCLLTLMSRKSFSKVHEVKQVLLNCTREVKRALTECVAGNLSNKKSGKRQRETSISVSAAAPRYVVTTTTSNYGVLGMDSSPRAEVKCKAKEEKNQSQVDVKKSLNWTNNSKSYPIEEQNAGNSNTEDQPVTTINVSELMAGLDDTGEFPEKISVEKQSMFFEKAKSLDHTITEIDARVPGNARENKYFGKENARPSKVKYGFGLSSPSGEIHFNKNSSPLEEIDFNKTSSALAEIDCNKYNSHEKVGFHVASEPSKKRNWRLGSHGSMTDLKAAASRRQDSSRSVFLDLIEELKSPIFDSNLIASFEKELKNSSEQEEWNAIRNVEGQRHRMSPRDSGFSWAVESYKNKDDTLGNFEEKCPPGEHPHGNFEEKCLPGEHQFGNSEEKCPPGEHPLGNIEEKCPPEHAAGDFDEECGNIEKKRPPEHAVGDFDEECPLESDKNKEDSLGNFEEKCPLGEHPLGNFEEKFPPHKNFEGKCPPGEHPLENIEEKCPPGGANAVVLYTTTLGVIRKTFDDCKNVRNVLESYGICISERDLSMHLEFGNELRKLMGGKVVTLPTVFIKGKYIGGAEEALRLHEEGKMADLIVGIPNGMAGKICDGCRGFRFVPCLRCSGSCKLVTMDNQFVRCPKCNENGLIQCHACC